MLKLFAAGALCALWLAGCAPPPAKDAVVSGSLVAEDVTTLPAGVKTQVEVLDSSEYDAEPKVLASQDITATAVPIPFSLTIPAAKMPATPALSIRARVAVGEQVMFVTGDNTIVAGKPTDVRLMAVMAVPLPYICGRESFRIAFTNQQAEVTDADRKKTVAPLVTPAAGAPADVHTYTGGGMTLVKKGIDVSFGRGKATPVACKIGE